jgi:uncharacterized protein (DUF427 family)
MVMERKKFMVELEKIRAGWTNTGLARPDFAIEPQAGQESVWDYPRPPLLVPDPREVVVQAGGIEVARSVNALRLLETASPPTFYLPPGDVCKESFSPASGTSFCEWKGSATYWDVQLESVGSPQAAWSYAEPFGDFAGLAGYFSFYPSRVECFVAGERVRAQSGGFYGGWITDEVIGPFKGDPGTGGW